MQEDIGRRRMPGGVKHPEGGGRGGTHSQTIVGGALLPDRARFAQLGAAREAQDFRSAERAEGVSHRCLLLLMRQSLMEFGWNA